MKNPDHDPGFRESAADERSERRRFGAGNWAALAILLGFLALATAFAVYVWNQLAGVDISGQGWIAMALGIIFTVVIGVGLMALTFYSSRRNYDR